MGIELTDYKGCLILAVPSKNDEGRWGVDVRVCLASSHEWKRYTSEETFEKEVEAIARSVILGKEIVDGGG